MADFIMDVGTPGAQANMVPATFISRNAEEDGIKAGRIVIAGTQDTSCLDADSVSPLSAGDIIGLATTDGDTGDAVRVATHGCFWVDVAGAVTPVSAVKYAPGTGKWGATGAVTVTGAKWDTSTGGSGGLAIVRLNGFAVSV